jgi:hypothetical protein
LTCWDFEPVGILDFGILSIGILACRDFEFRDFGRHPFLGVSDRKYLLEMFKMPKTLRDMYADLVRTANYDEQKANNLQVFGILHLGLWIQFTRLYRAGGSICIFRKDAISHHVDSKFSEDGMKSFLKLMAAVYQHKVSLVLYIRFHPSYCFPNHFTAYYKG